MVVKKATVVVVGEISQSPRMQYHALSLAENGYLVDIVCYAKSLPYKALNENTKINIKPIKSLPKYFVQKFPRIFNLIFKIFWDICQMLYLFNQLLTPEIVFIQNPPAIFVIGILWAYVKLKWKNTKLLIDWHNYGFSLFKLKYPNLTLLCWIYKWLEKRMKVFANYNLCVSNAMKFDLKDNFGINSIAVHDLPQRFFGANITLADKHALFLKLFPDPDHLGETIFTTQHENEISFKPNRPALLISSTSWTEDEDFSYLIYAMDQYETMLNDKSENILNDEGTTKSAKKYPQIIFVITGRGPLKPYYENIITGKHYKHIACHMIWLEAEDYPKLLAASDIGICLHKSSSGLDLPMKIVDMQACNLPVIAYEYPTLGELVVPGKNGIVFSTKQELYKEIKNLLQGYPDNAELAKMRSYIDCNKIYWQDNWNKCVKPLLSHKDDKEK